ncbi:MAG: SAM-dependent methyltransferase [Bacteroidota bacterium]
MASRFWDERFAQQHLVYGEEPNRFIRDAVDLPPGASIIDVGAGEGRNAVYLASLGYEVTAIDSSREGLAKLRRLADRRRVSVDVDLADVTTWAPERQWNGAIVTFLHLPSNDRPRLYRAIKTALRPGGRLFAEWFSPAQALKGYASGGPPRADMMISADELRGHFDTSGIRLAEELIDELDEGVHRGPAALTRFIWEKPA